MTVTTDFARRKAERVEKFVSIFRKKMVICSACNGSGYYDVSGSPKCAGCNGTGKVRER